MVADLDVARNELTAWRGRTEKDTKATSMLAPLFDETLLIESEMSKCLDDKNAVFFTNFKAATGSQKHMTDLKRKCKDCTSAASVMAVAMAVRGAQPRPPDL